MKVDKKLADRLVWRMAAFLRVLQTNNAYLIRRSAELVKGHAKMGKFGPFFTQGEIARVRKGVKFNVGDLLSAAERLKARGQRDAAVTTAAIYELFEPEFQGIHTARFEYEEKSWGGEDERQNEAARKKLEHIARDRRRTVEARRKAATVLYELGEVTRASKLVVAELTDALRRDDRYTSSELMLLLGVFGCYWSPDAEAARWEQQEREEQRRRDELNWETERRLSHEWPM